jgi:DNA-directed RNA polymerase specialized sigma24 family protein
MALQRPEKSADEIDHCAHLVSAALVVHLRDDGNQLCPETLVWVIRNAIRAREDELAERAARALLGTRRPDGSFTGGHCEAMIRAMAKDFDFADNDDARNDFRADCYERMWRKIKAGTEEEPFWESRFSLALKDVCIDVGRWMKVREAGLAALVDDEAADLPDVQRDTGAEEAILARMGAQRLRQLIRRLPRKMAQVAWLRWIEGYPEHSDDARQETVASVLHISDSMVRRYLREARERLTQKSEVQAIRNDLRSR